MSCRVSSFTDRRKMQCSGSIRPNRARLEHAFTIIELLVAMTILALLTVLIVNIVGMVTNTISSSSQKRDALSQARFCLDRLGVDFDNQLLRADLDHGISKKAGSDVLNFYSQVDGFSGARQVAALSYRVKDDPLSGLQLERGVQGAEWSGNTQPGFLPAAFPAVAESDFEVLSDSVFRLEFTYLKKDGTLSSQVLPDLSDVKSIVVAIAVLDAKTRKILTKEQVRLLSSTLADVQDGETPIVSWFQASFPSDIPLKATQGIRYYQRYYDIR